MFAESMTVGEAIGWGSSILDESDKVAGNSRADAALLLRHVLGISQAEMYACGERPLTPLETEAFNEQIRQRAKGAPIQYILGQWEFFGLPFQLTPDVLIPRPETEHLVEAAIARLKQHPAPRIADVGTGSGAIAVALAHALPQSTIVALDISAPALEVARHNAKQNDVLDRIQFVQSDLFATLADESFDAIVSNPPYVALSEKSSLPVEVRDYEPPLALFAGPTGFEIYQRLIAEAAPRLVPGGWLLLEIGHGQKEKIHSLLHNWNAVEFLPDLQGIPRVACARRPNTHS